MFKNIFYFILHLVLTYFIASFISVITMSPIEHVNDVSAMSKPIFWISFIIIIALPYVLSNSISAMIQTGEQKIEEKTEQKLRDKFLD